jgi:predicted O-methyltransferase YrrM
LNSLSFYLSLLKFSVLHPKEGLNLVNEANQVRDDNTQKFNNFEYNPVDISEALELITNNQNDCNNDVLTINNLKNHLESFFKNISGNYPSITKPYPIDYSIMGESGPFLYKLCKIIKPEIIVETGVAYGVSSSYILQALSENNKGKIISNDYIFRPWQSKKMIGSAIPKNLLQRWELKIGTSEKLLDDIFKKFSSIDIFLHDSLHTYKNMSFEFEKAWPFINEGGFLLSDDVISNNAFSDFYKLIKKQPVIMIQKKNPLSYLGILKK